MSHPAFTLAASIVLAIAFAALDDRSGRERAHVAMRVFFSAVATVVAGGWLMRLIHG